MKAGVLLLHLCVVCWLLIAVSVTEGLDKEFQQTELVDDVQIDESRQPSSVRKIPPPVEEGTVNIDLKDFLRLHESEERWLALLKNLTAPPAQPPLPPPFEYLIDSTSITGSAVGPVAELSIAFEVTILQGERWVSVPLLCAGSHVVKSYQVKRIGDQGEDKDKDMTEHVQFGAYNGFYTLFASRKGLYRIEVQVREPIHSKSTKPNMSINFANSLCATNWLNLTIPQGSFMSLTPSAYVTVTNPSSSEEESSSSASSNELVIATAHFLPTETLKIEWSVKENIEPKDTHTDGKKKQQQVPTTMRVQENILYDINDDGFITITASFYYDITLGKQSKFQIKFDEPIKILDVSGPAIDKWEIGYLKSLTGNQADEGKVLSIHTDQPMDKEFRVKVVAEIPSAFDLKKGNTTAEVLLPTFTALDVRRENLVIAISASPFLEVTELKRDGGVVRVDPRELGQLGWVLGYGSRGRAILFSYTSSTSAVRILLDLTKHKDVAVLPAIIESATLQSTLVSDRILYHFYINVRNSQKQYLRVDIPDKQYEVWSTFVAGQPVKPSSDETGALLVPIKKDFRMGGKDNMFLVEVVYYAPANKLEDKGDMLFKIPKLDIPITKFYLQLNLPTTHIFEKFEGADLLKMDSYSCPIPSSSSSPYEYQQPPPQQQQPQQDSYMFGAPSQAAYRSQPQRQQRNYMTKKSGYTNQARSAMEMTKEAAFEESDDVYEDQSGAGGGGGMMMDGMMMDDSTSFTLSSSASGGLDSGVLPVQIPALLVGERFCFERMLVHEKDFLSFKATYISKEKHNKSLLVWLHHATELCSSRAEILLPLILLLVMFSIPFLLWRCFRTRPSKRE